jgi:hypothetical protein
MSISSHCQPWESYSPLISTRVERIRARVIELIDISTVSALVVAFSVVVGLVFTLMELRHLARTRRTEVIMRIYERFGTKEMVEAMNSVGRLRLEKFEDWSKGGLTGFTQIAVIFEGLGVLLEEDLIDIKLVDSLFGPTLDTLWEPMRPLIYGMRESIKQPFFFSHFETLHDRLEEYRKEHPSRIDAARGKRSAGPEQALTQASNAES